MNFEKEANIENLLKYLNLDSIGRNKHLLKLFKILTNKGGNRYFSLDGEWGTGKTFFVKQLDLLINYCNSYNEGEKTKNNKFVNNSSCLLELNSDERNIALIEDILKKAHLLELKNLIQEECIYSVYFNAWEHDDEEDPLISIVYQLIHNYSYTGSGEKLAYKGNFELFKQAVKTISLGKIDIDDILTLEDLTKEIKDKNEMKESINKVFDYLICENCNRLIIIIDELDRCKPTYAVKLLERMRHYIVDDRITVLLSTNLKELQHTIGALYGTEFNATRYVSKFFDSRLILPNIDVDKYIKTFPIKSVTETNAWFSISVNAFIKYNRITEMREIDRYFTIIGFFEPYSFRDRMRMRGHENVRLMLELLMLPYIVGLYTIDFNEYSKFIRGDGFDKFGKYVISNQQLQSFVMYSLYSNKPNETIDNKTLLDEFERIYNALFIEKEKKFSYDYDLSYFADNISLLGDYAELEQKEEATT
ncbi:MAG: KAP family NTPase [Eubacteriaceae bacterium]|nr:KAP family NTPase [Eubacteriaceae bacterium]